MVCADRKTIIQVLGSLMNRPELLSDIDKYQLEPNDFDLKLDRYVYSAIYNLYVQGAERIHAQDVDNYLSSNEIAKRVIEDENGIQFLIDCETNTESGNFAYYYNKLKKFNLLRDLEKNGYDISSFYCDDPLNIDFEIGKRFETLTTEQILNHYKVDMVNLESKYVINTVVKEGKASDGIRNLIAELQQTPEVGIRLQGSIFNTITRGGRKGKLYLRSAGSGVGKTRSMVGDACNIAYPIRFEPKYGKWIATGNPEKVLYVMTEQETSEIQTMILAYLTGINEENFLYGTFTEEELERIEKAIQIMEMYSDYLLTAQVPDPSASVIKNMFRRYALQQGVENFFYDYIFSSPAMLNEYRDLGLREDVVLRMFTTVLKNLATELNVFILTSTQISNDEGEGFKDFKNIRGSKAIADLADFACIMSLPSKEELKIVSSGFQKLYNFQPNCVIDVFKNRRGRWTQLRIWTKSDLGTCRKYDLFVTTPDLKPIEDFQVVDFIQEKDSTLEELENKFNEGIEEIVEIQEISEEDPTSLLTDIHEAFGSVKEQVKGKDFSDYL